MAKLSPSQQGIVTKLAAGAKLEAHFDVWGPKPDGIVWVLNGSERVNRRTVEALRERGVIAAGETTRPYSGHTITSYTLAF